MRNYIGKHFAHYTLMLNKLILAIITILAAAAQPAMAARPKQDAVDRFTSSKAISRALAGVCVMDLATGRVVAGCNIDKGIVSASTMKVVTAASALELLGKDFTYHTRVYAIGDIDPTGRLTGKIRVVGSGDPTLGSRHFKERTAFVDTLVQCLQAAGITEIRGSIELDRSAIPDQPVPGYWMVEDIPESYGTGYHAINFADNQALVKFTRQWDGTYLAATAREIPGLRLNCHVREQFKGDTINRPGLTSRLYYNGGLLQIDGIVARRRRGRENFASWYANPAPHRLLADSIEQSLSSHDIGHHPSTEGLSHHTGDTLQLLDYPSPPLTEILESMLFRSDNMYAEGVLRTLPLAAGLPATTANGVHIVNKLWKSRGLDTDGLAMKDGSGLARNGWATPQFLCDVLRLAYADRDSIGADYSQLLPRAGREGSVKRLLLRTPLRGKIVLKSGSMGGVQCYAGYYPASRPRYAVAIMVNNFPSKRSQVVSQVQTLLLDLFGSN